MLQSDAIAVLVPDGRPADRTAPCIHHRDSLCTVAHRFNQDTSRSGVDLNEVSGVDVALQVRRERVVFMRNDPAPNFPAQTDRQAEPRLLANSSVRPQRSKVVA
jgi:hypothetical protein